MSTAPEIRNVFIRRPIFSGVISIVIVLLGLFALRTLPVNSYPAHTPPEIRVEEGCPSAPQHDERGAVAAPLEHQQTPPHGLPPDGGARPDAGLLNPAADLPHLGRPR